MLLILIYFEDNTWIAPPISLELLSLIMQFSNKIFLEVEIDIPPPYFPVFVEFLTEEFEIFTLLEERIYIPPAPSFAILFSKVIF